jgi:hypothetical protein
MTAYGDDSAVGSNTVIHIISFLSISRLPAARMIMSFAKSQVIRSAIPFSDDGPSQLLDCSGSHTRTDSRQEEGSIMSKIVSVLAVHKLGTDTSNMDIYQPTTWFCFRVAARPVIRPSRHLEVMRLFFCFRKAIFLSDLILSSFAAVA